MSASVAVVESTFQLWSLHEGIRSGHVDPPDVVLARGSASRLDGLPAIDPRLSTRVRRTGRLDAVRLMRSASELVVGDAFSGLFAVGARRLPERLTLLDDGAASLHLARVIGSEGGSLVRAHDERRWRAALGERTHARLRRAGGSVRWVTGFPSLTRNFVEAPLEIALHDWLWFREVSSELERTVLTKRIVIGSAMVADGLLDEKWYANWLTLHCRRGDVTFVPHRRELPVHRDLAVRSGAELEATALPVEFLLAAAERPDLEVACLPSTPVLTIPRLFPGRLALTVDRPPDGSWTPRATAGFRALADAIVAVPR